MTSNVISYLLSTRHVAQNGDVAELCLQKRREAWGELITHFILVYRQQTNSKASRGKQIHLLPL